MTKKTNEAKSALGGKDKTEKNLEKSIEELEDQLKRSVADFQNYEKRVTEERKQLIKFANFELLQQLLPAFDTLFLAEKYVEDEGLKYTIKSLQDKLNEIGVERIETEGKKFTAVDMECTETVAGEKGMVIEETRPGYKLHGRVIRPAGVKVGK